MTTWLSQLLRPLSPIWWALIIATGILFALWAISRAALAILKMRFARSRISPERVGKASYVNGVLWDLARTGLWTWLSFCVVCEARSGRMGPGMYHGPMYRSQSPVLFYLLEAFFLVVGVNLVASALSSLRKRRASERQRLATIANMPKPGSSHIRP
jgi:hypothetical protein